MIDTFELFGVATSAYQIEGNVSGKPESVWDRFTHTNTKLESGDVACDEVNRYDETIGYLKDLGVNTYRFSMSWTRCYTEEGIKYYHDLINKLQENKIEPMVTIYHWDHPQSLEDKGGWVERFMVDEYVEYAKKLFIEFPTVKYWITHNEPRVVSTRGYGSSTMAPGRNNPKLIDIVNHHLLLSHGLAVKEFRKLNQTGKIGITLNLKPVYCDNDNIKKAEKLDREKNLFYLDLLFGKHTEFKNIPSSDLDIISTPIDFLGVNYYSRDVITTPDFVPLDTNCLGWEVYPEGIYDILIIIQDTYGSKIPPIIITENGFASKDELINNEINDTNRIEYIFNHIEAVKRAQKDGVRVIGFMVWSGMDNLEWSFGYNPRFGIIYVDFETQKRYPKNSFYALKKYINGN